MIYNNAYFKAIVHYDKATGKIAVKEFLH